MELVQRLIDEYGKTGEAHSFILPLVQQPGELWSASRIVTSPWGENTVYYKKA